MCTEYSSCRLGSVDVLRDSQAQTGFLCSYSGNDVKSHSPIETCTLLECVICCVDPSILRSLAGQSSSLNEFKGVLFAKATT